MKEIYVNSTQATYGGSRPSRLRLEPRQNCGTRYQISSVVPAVHVTTTRTSVTCTQRVLSKFCSAVTECHNGVTECFNLHFDRSIKMPHYEEAYAAYRNLCFVFFFVGWVFFVVFCCF